MCVWQVLDRENAPVMKLPLTPQALDKLVADAGLGGADAGGQIGVEFLAVRGAALLQTPAVSRLGDALRIFRVQA